jgi:hypothetical protein
MNKLTIRIPEELYRALREIADQEERSLNSQIVYLLKRGVENTQGAIAGQKPAKDNE